MKRDSRSGDDSDAVESEQSPAQPGVLPLSATLGG